MTRSASILHFLLLAAGAVSSIQVAAGGTAAVPNSSDDYQIIVSKQTLASKEWKLVVEALVEKHGGSVTTYSASPKEVLGKLSELHPRYTCFVATREEATKEFVASVHQLTRAIDDDPYTDTFWGILTGFDAQNALGIANHREPLVVRKVASGTEFAIELCEEGLWYDELVKNKFVLKEKNGEVQYLGCPSDTTEALVGALNEYKPDLFITSGHATEANWQIGFRYRNGYFKSKAGQMYGEDTTRKQHAVDSPNAKVYLPIGNCLMGNINGRNAMALAWMNDCGVKQMIGYTVPTWFGYGGWGVLDYFVEQPGRYSLTEAYFANHQALLHSIEMQSGNQQGLKFDRDVVAFYGDPKWEARMASADLAYGQTLTIEDGLYTFTVTPNLGESSFEPINTNGAQRGWRPIVHWLPHRVSGVQIESGADLKPLVTDDFILIPNPRTCDPSKSYQVTFRASAFEPKQEAPEAGEAIQGASQ
ncbi:MAG: hypothetical protein AAF483_12125 [Planctomycetota bacterium]